MSYSIANESEDWLSDIEYKALLELYNNYNTAFKALPDYMQSAFYARLYNKPTA